MAEPMVPNPIRSKDLLAVSPPKKPQSQAQVSQMALKTSAEIIEQSARRELPGQDMTRFMQTLGYMVQTKMVQLLQIGNTVLMLKPLPEQPGTVELHTFTIETPQDLVQRYQAAANSLRQLGFKKVLSYATSPAFVKLADQTGLPIRVSQSQTMVGNQMVPAYRFELDL